MKVIRMDTIRAVKFKLEDMATSHIDLISQLKFAQHEMMNPKIPMQWIIRSSNFSNDYIDADGGITQDLRMAKIYDANSPNIVTVTVDDDCEICPLMLAATDEVNLINLAISNLAESMNGAVADLKELSL